MTTTAVPVSSTRAALPAARGRAGFGGALRSELTKIRSVRSTYWSLLALVVITIGIGALFAFGRVQNFTQVPVGFQAAERARDIAQAAETSLFGLIVGQLVIALVTSFASFLVGQAVLSTHHLNTTLGQPGVLRAVIGGGLFLAVCGLLSFGLGAVLRHTAGAITASI